VVARTPNGFQLPKDSIKKADLGQSFAEYDVVRTDPQMFVETPSMRAAAGRVASKCIFVGRRGSGKTATTYYLEGRDSKRTALILPELFSSLDVYVKSDSESLSQRTFKTIVTSFKRSLLDEAVAAWQKNGSFSFVAAHTFDEIKKERNFVEQFEFDTRTLGLVEEGINTLHAANEKEWNRFNQRSRKLIEQIIDASAEPKRNLLILIDRIDEDWDGTNDAVTVLMALMHACVELNAISPSISVLLFVRENMFDRVRQADLEFSRLETSVISLDWTRELLRELVERRLRRHLIAKPALGGPTWNAFFEGEEVSENMVFSFCQPRPRDILAYCSFALQIAQSHQHSKVMLEDLAAAKRRFSESRLKELCDEYAENYPQLRLVLTRFFGLGKRFTSKAIDDFLKKILTDEEVQRNCQRWIYQYTTPYAFTSLLYGIGFAGIANSKGEVQFKVQETQPFNPDQISHESLLVIHDTYADALQLRDVLIPTLDERLELKRAGLLEELPQSFEFGQAYRSKLEELQTNLMSLPRGRDHYSEYEGIVGEVIRLCFFRALSNVESRVRTVDNRSVRDWIAGNHSQSGFWKLVRDRYAATQVIFECKNYDDLSADDFGQVGHYMNDRIGRFCVIMYRGGPEIKQAYYAHIREIAIKHGLVLLLGERDLEVLLRQAINGKSSERHLQELFDNMIRKIS
jgi:hypothetical protein